MNTPDSTRVEVTKALLADLEAKARATKGAGEAWTYVTNGLAGRVFGKATAFELGQDTGRRRGIALTPSEPYAAFAVAAQPSVVLALVERIRELESKERQLDAAEDHIRVLEAYIRDPHASTACSDRATFDPRCGGCEGCITLQTVHSIQSAARLYDSAGPPLDF